MKRLFAAALLALTTLAFGATTTPPSLINPSGSTAGQAIISTGASSAPVWGAPSVSSPTGTLPIANGGTGATSASAALSNLGGLSTTTAASTYATIANLALKAPLASPTFTGTVTIPTGASITKPTIVGTVAADNASAGSVGELISSTVAVGSAVSLTSNTAANITSIVLTPGDWDVWGSVATNPAGTTTQSFLQASLSTTSATLGGLPNGGGSVTLPFSVTAGNPVGVPVGMKQYNVSSNTTVYLVINSTFATSTNSAYGFIAARRRR